MPQKRSIKCFRPISCSDYFYERMQHILNIISTDVRFLLFQMTRRVGAAKQSTLMNSSLVFKSRCKFMTLSQDYQILHANGKLLLRINIKALTISYEKKIIKVST